MTDLEIQDEDSVPFVLPDEQAAILFADVTHVPFDQEFGPETLAAALRSLMSIGMATLELDPDPDPGPDPDSDDEGRDYVTLALPPADGVRSTMRDAPMVTVVTLAAGTQRRLYVLYGSSEDDFLLEELLDDGFRSYVPYPHDQLRSDIDALFDSLDDSDGQEAGSSGADHPGDDLPDRLVMTAPFDQQDEPAAQRLADELELVLTFVRTDRVSGHVDELTLAGGLRVGSFVLETSPPPPAPAESVVASRSAWDGQMVLDFLLGAGSD